MDNDLTLTEALEVTAGGLALLVAQGVIVSDPFFGRREIEKYLKHRRRFHSLFAAAAEKAADEFEQDPNLRQVALGLRMFANSQPRQFQRALMGAERSLRALRRVAFRDVDPTVRERLGRTFAHLKRITEMLGGELEFWDLKSSWTNLFESLVKYKAIPAPLRTLFRKLAKMTPSKLPESADPGAWFNMAPEQKVGLRKRVRDVKRRQEEAAKIEDADERSRVLQETFQQLANLQGEAGVNLQIIEREDETPLDDLLKAERKLVRDGPTEYVADNLTASLRDAVAKHPDYYKALTKRELNKLVKLIAKAKTFTTLTRVLKEAVDRKILSQSWVEGLQNQINLARKNKVLANDAPLTPIPFEPKTPEQFRSEHDTGDIEFVGDWSEDEKARVLGRCSAAIAQLETLYGKGFCGKHARKLAFRFYDDEGGSARASYFGWDDRSRWQPRVKFGKDFDGVLAHELSHYLDDLLAYKVGKEQGLIPEYQYGDIGHGPGDMFGNTGQSVEYWLESAEKRVSEEKSTVFNAPIKEVPEAIELMRLVVSLPDYERWSDKLGQLEFYVEPAVRNIMGKDPMEDSEVAHLALGKVQYRSELPPEVLEEAIRLFTKDMGGDTRKLTYWNSSSEVWARLCEQYVYTKLAEQGIANPWLTHMTYDVDIKDMFVEDATFTEKVVPIMDRLFARLKERKLLARLLGLKAQSYSP